MKFVFKIKTKPMTQASIIIAIVAVSLGSLELIVIYFQSFFVCIFCAVVLTIIVYVVLRLAPC
jgi:hypothetical protein